MPHQISSIIATIGLLAAGTAGAQTAVVPPAPAEKPAASAGIEEIVVTAQRRSENLQKVAVAVSALNSETLLEKGVVSPADLTKLLPAVNIEALSGGSLQVLLRGVGSFAGNPQTEAGVAINYDGVYVARGQGANGVLYDIDRVELLKGPQGTLYGRNSTAGALNIITHKPKLDEYSVDFTAELGNYNLGHGTLVVNAPLVENKLAIRIGANVVSRDGYLSDGYQDDHQYSTRAQLLAKPTDDLSVLLSFDFAKQYGMGSDDVPVPFANPNNPWLGKTAGYFNTVLAQTSLFLTGGATSQLLPFAKADGYLDNHTTAVSATIDYNFEGMTLTVIPALRWTDVTDHHFGAGFPVFDIDRSQERTLEARLSSNDDGPFKWIAGAYYFYEATPYDLTFNQGVAAADNHISTLDTLSESAFGQVSYAIVPDFRLTGGARYTREHKTQNGYVTYGPGLSPGVAGDITFKQATWKVGAEYDVAPDSLLYANVGTGFKAGGFYNSLAPNTFQPEKLTAYTLGSKNRFFDNTLQVNLEGFYWTYKDKQVSHLAPVTPVGFNLITSNAGSATIEGAEADIVWRATPSDKFNAVIELEHSNYDKFSYKQTILTGPPATGCAVRPLDASDVTVDCSGRPVSFSPVATINLGYDHTFALSDGSAITAGISSRLQTSSWLGDEFLPGEHQSFSTITDLDVIWTSPSANLSIMGYVDNVQNNAVGAGSFVYPITGQPLIVMKPPRTFGGRLQYHYDTPAAAEPAYQQPPMPAPALPVQQPKAASPAPEVNRDFQVFFDFDQSVITDVAASVIQAAADVVKGGGVAKVMVTGHTDTVGSAAYNQKLSEQRATAVKQKLIADGVKPDEVATVGVGKIGLLVPTADGVREPQNRRAEIHLD